MKTVLDLDSLKGIKKIVIDKEDFPISFCPLCGSEHLTGHGKNNPLLNGLDSYQMHCNTCFWDFEIFLLMDGKKITKLRFDSEDCKQCKKRLKP